MGGIRALLRGAAALAVAVGALGLSAGALAADGPPPVLVGHITGAINPITAFVVGTSSVYFASSGTDGAVEKAPLVKPATDEPNFVVARSQEATTSIALDATKVIWANNCAIMSAPQ